MLENTKVVVPGLLRKHFDLAYKHNRVLLFHAPCGCGKTVVARELLKQNQVCYLSAADDAFSLDAVSPRCKVLLVDDLHLLEGSEAPQALCKLIRTRQETHFVLLSRGAVPGWLMPFQFAGIMESFTIEDLLLDKTSIETLAAAYGVSLTSAETAAILKDTRGYPVALALLMGLISEQGAYREEILNTGRQQLFLYFDELIYRRFEPPMKRLLIAVAPFEPFDVEMAKLLSGDSHAGEIVAALQKTTSMLQPGQSEKLNFQPIFRSFLLWKLSQEPNAEERKELFSRAGLYYELHDEMKTALDCYAQVGNHRKISELLVKNAERHVGIGQYLEMEQYYFAMPQQEILRSPVLMAGMSMLCSLFMDYEQSEFWYTALQEFAHRLKKSDPEYKDAQGRLAYLNIALPQRGTKGLMTVISTVFDFFREKQLNLPTFSVTSTLPSLMNGGKDFCEWSKKDDILYATMQKPVEGILGRDGIGLADCAICESKFEKGENYQPKLLALMSRLTEIQRKGSPDMEFAAVGLLARVQTAQGQSKAALESLKNLRGRFEELGEKRFLPNLDALICRIQMRQGNMAEANRWLAEKAPADDLRIWVLYRYQYMTKAMVQIANGDCNSALLLLVRLLPYTEKCCRTMDQIYIHILTAICYFRMGNGQWKQKFSMALDLSCEHRFIRPIADYGVAVLPLLNQCGWKKNTLYLEKVVIATRTQAVNYPQFLKREERLAKPLTAAEQQVLKLLCHNMSNQEICDILGIKLATCKTHVSRILQKLEVDRRSEAKAAAEKLQLI
jgi:LuxR family maltose regulon positive regulatory protein